MTNRGRIIVGIKQVARDKYAWPGGYPLFTCLADGEVLCAECTKKELGLIVTATANPGQDRQWEAMGHAVNWESEDLYCAHCEELIESAY